MFYQDYIEPKRAALNLEFKPVLTESPSAMFKWIMQQVDFLHTGIQLYALKFKD